MTRLKVLVQVINRSNTIRVHQEGAAAESK